MAHFIVCKKNCIFNISVIHHMIGTLSVESVIGLIKMPLVQLEIKMCLPVKASERLEGCETAGQDQLVAVQWGSG